MVFDEAERTRDNYEIRVRTPKGEIEKVLKSSGTHGVFFKRKASEERDTPVVWMQRTVACARVLAHATGEHGRGVAMGPKRLGVRAKDEESAAVIRRDLGTLVASHITGPFGSKGHKVLVSVEAPGMKKEAVLEHIRGCGKVLIHQERTADGPGGDGGGADGGHGPAGNTQRPRPVHTLDRRDGGENERAAAEVDCYAKPQ